MSCKLGCELYHSYSLNINIAFYKHQTCWPRNLKGCNFMISALNIFTCLFFHDFICILVLKVHPKKFQWNRDVYVLCIYSNIIEQIIYFYHVLVHMHLTLGSLYNVMHSPSIYYLFLQVILWINGSCSSDRNRYNVISYMYCVFVYVTVCVYVCIMNHQ